MTDTMTADRVLFVEDEFDFLDPIARRLGRKKVDSDTRDYDAAGDALAKVRYDKIVFDQLFPGGRLGTSLYLALQRGDFGPLNMTAKCAFYTALGREAVSEVLMRERFTEPVRIILKSDGLLPLYQFLGIAEPASVESSRARTLVEIVRVTDRKQVDLLVPGWRSEEEVRVSFHRFPAVIARELREEAPEGRLYSAMANLGAEHAAGLGLAEFDILKEE